MRVFTYLPLMLGLSLATCRVPTPVPTPTPPDTTWVEVHVQVCQDPCGPSHMLPATVVRLDTGPVTVLTQMTGADGQTTFRVPRTLTQSHLWVTRAGFVSVDRHLDIDGVSHLVQVTLRPTVALPQGVVTTDRFVFRDGDGPFLGLGASLFWGTWGYKSDRNRLMQNVAFLAKHGVQYVRVLGVVGPRFWTDRTADPTWPDYDAVIAALTDDVYAAGMRVEWTIFGGTDTTPTPAVRRALVDRFAAMARGREHKIMHFEIANEGWQTGFEGASGRDELRTLARHLDAQTTVPVAVTAPPDTACETIVDYYQNNAGNLITLHFDRSRHTSEGLWRAVRQPWREAAFHCGSGVPYAISNNEPIGPQASVAEDDDPVRLTMGAAVSYLTGVGTYVYHASPGIWGGGVEGRQQGHPADWWDTTHVLNTLQGLRGLRDLLPADLANWEKMNGHWPTMPVTAVPYLEDGASATGIVRLYGARQGSQAVLLVLGVRGSVTLTAKQTLVYTVYHPVTGATLGHGAVAAGQSFALDDRIEGYIILVNLS